LRDLQLLGITTVAELSKCEAKTLYAKLCQLSEERHDPCMEDVLNAAVAQAKNPELAKEKCDWWYWNRRRKKKR